MVCISRTSTCRNCSLYWAWSFFVDNSSSTATSSSEYPQFESTACARTGTQSDSSFQEICSGTFCQQKKADESEKEEREGKEKGYGGCEGRHAKVGERWKGNMLQCATVCWRQGVLQCVNSVLHRVTSMSQCVIVCCSVLLIRCFAICCSVLSHSFVRSFTLCASNNMCCSMLQCVAICCSVLSHPCMLSVIHVQAQPKVLFVLFMQYTYPMWLPTLNIPGKNLYDSTVRTNTGLFLFALLHRFFATTSTMSY